VICPKVSETTALGAAYLAGLTVGYWQDRDEIAKTDRKFEPQMLKAEVEKHRTNWKKAVERASLD